MDVDGGIKVVEELAVGFKNPVLVLVLRELIGDVVILIPKLISGYFWFTLPQVSPKTEKNVNISHT